MCYRNRGPWEWTACTRCFVPVLPPLLQASAVVNAALAPTYYTSLRNLIVSTTLLSPTAVTGQWAAVNPPAPSKSSGSKSADHAAIALGVIAIRTCAGHPPPLSRHARPPLCSLLCMGQHCP